MYYFFFFFFNDTATTEIYTLSLHDALPICMPSLRFVLDAPLNFQESPDLFCLDLYKDFDLDRLAAMAAKRRSEEHTSELQSQSNLVCRLLLEKKKKIPNTLTHCAFRQAGVL